MTDKHFKPSTVSGDNRVFAKDAITECSEDFMQSLDAIPSHPSFIQPLLEQGEISEDGRKLLRKIKQDPEWKKRVEKMLSFEAHTLKGRLSWEQDKLKEQKRSLSSQKEEGENTHSGQLQQISQLKQSLREHMTNRIKLESNLAEDKRINKKLAEDYKKAAKPKPKLSEVMNRTGPTENQISVPLAESIIAPSVLSVESTDSRLITPTNANSVICYTEADELSIPPSPTSENSSIPSPSHSDRPSSRESTVSKRSKKSTSSPRRNSPSPIATDRTASKMSYSLSEAIGKQSSTQSQDSVKFPKITNSALISAPEPIVKSPPIRQEGLIQFGIASEESNVSMKSKCSHCGTKKTRNSPHGQSLHTSHTQEYQHSPNSFYAHTPSYHRTATLPSHNLHMSSPPVIIQHAPIPYSYIQPCHECVPAPQHHHCHQQHRCSPCHVHKEESRFNQEFESLKEFIREEIRSGWTKSPRSRRAKPYNSSREYTASETTTASETDSEDPYLLCAQTHSSVVSKGTHPSKSYKPWKNQDTESIHSLAATHSLQSKRSEVSSILEDELFMKLVSNPAKYSYELQEIAKLLTSPPASRASSTTSRQKLRTIKHLVRDAICSYSTSELESSDTNEEGPLTEESEGNLSRLEHVSSRTIHKARKAKEMKSEVAISPKPSILKTSSRLTEQNIEPCVSLTGLKRVNFSSETINIDDGQPTQLNNIPDDYVVVGEDEISLAAQEIREAEQTAVSNIQESHSANSRTDLAPEGSSADLAYPYDQYMAGELEDPCTILQNQNGSVSPSSSRASQRGRADAASRVLSELGMGSDTNIKLSYSHSLELKASLPSIPSYISEAESRNSIGIRPNRPALESNTGVAEDTRPSRLLSSSRASLKQVAPQREGEDELEIEKRVNRQEILALTVNTDCADEVTDSDNIEPAQPCSRKNSLTLREHESMRSSMTQFSRISLVSRPSIQVNNEQQQQQHAVSEEVSLNEPGEKIEKQTSKSSLASRIFSSFTSLVSLKPSGSKSSVVEQGSNTSIHSNVSSMSLSSKPADSVSRTGSKQDIQKAASCVSRTASKQDEVQKAASSVSRAASNQEDIQKPVSSVSRTASKQEEIQKAASSVSRTASKQEEIQKAASSVSRSASKQEEIQKAVSSVSRTASKQDEIQKAVSSVSRTASKQEEIQKAASSVSRTASKQDEIQKAASSVSRTASKQEENQKAASSVSRTASKQEEIQKAASSVSRTASKQEEIQKAASSVSRTASKQEEIQKAASSVSRTASKQEEIQKAASSVSRTASKQDEIQKAASSVSRTASKQEEIQKAASSVSRTASKQEEIQKAASSVSRTASKQEEIQKAASSVSRTASKQDEIQKAASSVSRTASKQDEIQKAASSVSRTASKQDEIQKAASSVSRTASKQDEIQKAASSVSRTASKQEENQKAASSVSRTASKQEEIQKAASSVSRTASNQDEIQKAVSSVSRTASKQEEIQKAASSVGRTASKQEDISAVDNDEFTSANTENSSPQCECTDCPDPTQCTDCPNTALPPEQTNAESQVDSILSPEAPVKIVLSPEVVAKVEENEPEMGVVMKFSEEWKIICTKDCPSGVEETTITDWRDPTVETDPLQVSESAPHTRAYSEITSQDLQTGTKSLDSIEVDTAGLSSKDNIKSDDTTVELHDPIAQAEVPGNNLNESGATQQQVDTSSNKEETVVTQDNNTSSPIVIEDNTAGVQVSSPKGEEISSEDTVEERAVSADPDTEQDVANNSTVSNQAADKEDTLQESHGPDDTVESHRDEVSPLTDNTEVVTDPVETNEVIVIHDSYENPPENNLNDTEINDSIKPSKSAEDEAIPTDHTADNITEVTESINLQTTVNATIEGEIPENQEIIEKDLSQNETENALTNPDQISPNTSAPPETKQA